MINNISVHELPYILETEGEQAVLIDVREPVEFNTCHIPSSCPMPISANLVDNLQTLSPQIIHWIFVCQHGVRSKKAAELAKSLGKDVTISHVVGGVSAWAAVHPLPSV